jgi:hypothetical protein
LIYISEKKHQNKMSTVNINEILGTDSISGSRITLNSNFLILQNWINGYVNVFGVDTINGIINLSSAPTGSVLAKIGRFDSFSTPANGTALSTVNQLGQASFVSVSTTTFTASGSLTLQGTVTIQSSGSLVSAGTATFNNTTNLNSEIKLGPNGHVVSQNTTYQSGTAGTAFPSTASGGGGKSTSVNSPYAITGLEDVIYAACGPTGFFMKVVDGNSPVGGTLPNIAQGTRVTIVNTSSSAGTIVTGVTGTTSTYYTGFNTSASYGGYGATGIFVPSSKAYRSSVTLQWEPRVGQGQATENGSWVVIGSSNINP